MMKFPALRHIQKKLTSSTKGEKKEREREKERKERISSSKKNEERSMEETSNNHVFNIAFIGSTADLEET